MDVDHGTWGLIGCYLGVFQRERESEGRKERERERKKGVKMEDGGSNTSGVV